MRNMAALLRAIEVLAISASTDLDLQPSDRLWRDDNQHVHSRVASSACFSTKHYIT